MTAPWNKPRPRTYKRCNYCGRFMPKTTGFRNICYTCGERIYKRGTRNG